MFLHFFFATHLFVLVGFFSFLFFFNMRSFFGIHCVFFRSTCACCAPLLSRSPLPPPSLAPRCASEFAQAASPPLRCVAAPQLSRRSPPIHYSFTITYGPRARLLFGTFARDYHCASPSCSRWKVGTVCTN